MLKILRSQAPVLAVFASLVIADKSIAQEVPVSSPNPFKISVGLPESKPTPDVLAFSVQLANTTGDEVQISTTKLPPFTILIYDRTGSFFSAENEKLAAQPRRKPGPFEPPIPRTLLTWKPFEKKNFEFRLSTYWDKEGVEHPFSPGMYKVSAIKPVRFFRRNGQRIENAETVLIESEELRFAVGNVDVPEVGKPAPDFSVLDMNGATQTLAQLRGKKNLLLTFFPKCFTGGCANHLSSLRDQQAAFDASDTQVMAVSVDPAEGEQGQLAFAKQWNLAFSLVPDTQRKLSLLYGAAQTSNDLATRQSVLIDKEGIVRLVDRKVNVQTHGVDVLNQMRELGLVK